MAYQYRRPYYPRVYQNRYQQNTGQTVNQFGESLVSNAEKLAKVIQADQQNKVANQLAAQYGLYAPRAQWVGGTPPAAGVNTQGTSLADQGGVEGLKMRMAMQQRQQTQQAAQTKAQLQQALVDQARGKAKSVWTGRTPSQTQTPSQTPSGKTGKYQAGSYNYENGTLNGVKTPDSMQMLQADVDSESGKNGTAGALLAAIPQMQVVNGKLTIPPPTDANGKPLQDSAGNPIQSKYRFNADGSFSVVDANGNPTATIRADQMPTVLNRFNALQVRNGQTPLPNPYLKGTEQTSTFQPGTQENPYALDLSKPNTTFRALPFGSYFKDPKGNIQLKQGPQQQQQTVQQPSTPAAQFSTPSEGGTSTDLLKATRPDTGGVTIPLRRTGSTDESGGDSALAQNQLPSVPAPNTPVLPNAPVDTSGGTIARIDPNAFAPPSQQDRNQVADVTLPNRDVVPVVTDDQREMLNRMIAGQNLVDQYAQT